MTFTIVAFCMPAAPKAFQGLSIDILARWLRFKKQSENNVNGRLASISHQNSEAKRKYHRVEDNLFRLISLPTHPEPTITKSDSRKELHNEPPIEAGILRTTHVEVREEFVGHAQHQNTTERLHPWTTDSPGY